MPSTRRRQRKRSSLKYAQYAQWMHYFPVEPTMKGQPQYNTKEAQFSITVPSKAHDTFKIIQQYIQLYIKKPINQCTLTDGTACVGGDTLSFSKHFKHVNAVETNPVHARMLIHNVNVYGRKNVTVYEGDYTKLARTLQQDVVFLDPPWGGVNYKKNKQTPLFLSNYPISYVASKLLHNRAKLIVLKVPINFAFGTLFGIPGFSKERRQPLFKSVHVHHLGNMAIVILHMNA